MLRPDDARMARCAVTVGVVVRDVAGARRGPAFAPGKNGHDGKDGSGTHCRIAGREEPLSRRPHSGFAGWSHAGGLAVTIELLVAIALFASSAARAQEVGEPLNAPPPQGEAAPAAESPQIGTPINEAEVRDAALGGPEGGSAADRAPFTPMATSELGRGGQGLDPVRPLSPNTGTGLKLTPWLQVQPWVRNATFYDSNIFRAPEGEEVADVEITNTIGIDVAATTRRTELDIGYTATLRTWLDSNGTADEHRGRLRFAAVGRLLSARARLDAGLLSRPDDPRFTGAAVDRFILDAGGSLAINLSRNVSLVPETFASYQDFRGGQFDRNDTMSYGGNLLVGLSPGGRVTVLLGGGYRELRYTSDDAIASDLAIYSAILGLELRLRRLSGQVRVGYDWSRIIDERQAGDEEPPRGLTTGIALTWQALRLTTVTFDVTRGINFTTTATPVFTTRAGVTITQQLPLQIAGTARLMYEVFEPSGGGDSVDSVFGALGLAWEPRRWLQLGVEGSYMTRDGGGGGAGGFGGEFEVFRLGAVVTLRF